MEKIKPSAAQLVVVVVRGNEDQLEEARSVPLGFYRGISEILKPFRVETM